MHIKKCPGCAGYLHFDEKPAGKSCWNCGAFTDFSRRNGALQKSVEVFDRRFCAAVAPLFFIRHERRLFRVALLAALPTAVFMLLLGNSFEIRVIADLQLPFLVMR